MAFPGVAPIISWRRGDGRRVREVMGGKSWSMASRNERGNRQRHLHCDADHGCRRNRDHADPGGDPESTTGATVTPAAPAIDALGEFLAVLGDAGKWVIFVGFRLDDRH